MRIVELKNVHRENAELHYRKVFKAQAVLEFPQEKIECPIEIQFEHTPLGKIETRVNIKRPIGYPLLPVLKKLTSYANDMYQKGDLR